MTRRRNADFARNMAGIPVVGVSIVIIKEARP
jgi:hypothetical protein